MSVFLRDAETPIDYKQRPYRSSSFTREIVRVLTQHLYAPGPSRKWSDAGGQDFLDTVYTQNHIDATMKRADELSTLNDHTAIQVDAGDGVFAEKPITLRLWGRQDFHVWTDPDDRNIPQAVVTRDRYDLTTRYRLFTEEKILTFETKKAEQTTGGRVANQVGPAEKNTYGCLPFAFQHYEQPITRFFEAGISDGMIQAEVSMNRRLSRLDNSIDKHLDPIPVLENCEDGFQLILGTQRAIRLNSNRMRPSASGGMEDGPQPKAYYLEMHIDVAGAWDDLLKFINQCLEAWGIPLSAIRMEQTGIASGIALVCEQAPLLTRARTRRSPWGVYEHDLARTILTCAGNHYRKSALLAASAGIMSLGWPMASVPVPTDDNFKFQLDQVNAGIISLPMLIQQFFGMSREEAFMQLEQVEADNSELKKRAPKLHAALMPASEPQQFDPEGNPIPTKDPDNDQVVGLGA